MNSPNSNLAQQAAFAACTFQKQQSGNTPRAISAAIDGRTLTVTLHGTLSQAEKSLAKTPKGAKQVREFHQHLFANSAVALREEVTRITGVLVNEATAEIEPVSGAMVQVYQLAADVPPENWHWDALAGPPPKKYTAPYMT